MKNPQMPSDHEFLNLLSRWVLAGAFLKSPFEGMSATFQYKAPKKRTMVQNIVEPQRASQDFHVLINFIITRKVVKVNRIALPIVEMNVNHLSLLRNFLIFLFL